MTGRLFMTTDAVGGVWRYSVTLGRELTNRGWRVLLAVVGPSPGVRRGREAESVGCESLCMDAQLDWLAGDAGLYAGRRRLIEAAVAWGADIVHLNQPAYGGEEWPTPPVVVAHSCLATWWRAVHCEPPPAAWRWHHDAVSRGLAAAAIAAAPSCAFARQLADAYRRVPHALPVRNGAPASPAPVTEKQAFVLAAGRIWDRGKNLAALDEAAADVLWPVRIAGPARGADGASLTLRHAEAMGELAADSMAAAQRAASIFVSPSLYEPFGLAVLEAAQAGAALALSDIPAHRELWSDAAAFFDPRRPQDVARTVNDLITDDLRRSRLAEAARRRARDYDIRATADAMERLYAGALGRADIALGAA